MQDEKHKYKVETLKLTTMLEKTLKELAAIKKEHQRTVGELNQAQHSRDQIIQILKKQVAHEVQERERLWAENNQLYLRLSRIEEGMSQVNLLEGIEVQSQSRIESNKHPSQPRNADLERLVEELRAEIEVLKSQKEDVLLRAQYESTIEYNKLRSEFHGTQEKLIRMEEQLKMMERSEYKLIAEKRELETALSGLRNKSEGDRFNNEENGVNRQNGMLEVQLRAEVDKLRHQNEFLKEVKADLEQSANEYETIICEYRASLDEARMKYDNRQLQYLRERNTDRADRDLLRTEVERLKFQSVKKQDHLKKIEDKDGVIKHLERQLLSAEAQNRQLLERVQESVTNQRSDFASGLELVKQQYHKNIEQKESILAEYKREHERLVSINEKLEDELTQALSQQSKLKESRIKIQASRDEQNMQLQISYAELRKEKELYEMRTKQELSRLQREVTEMIELDTANEQFNKDVKAANDKLTAENKQLGLQLHQLNQELTNVVGQKIQLGTQMEELSAQLASYRLRTEKLSRELERSTVREREEDELRSELTATTNRVRQQQKELQRLRTLNFTSEQREKQLTAELTRERLMADTHKQEVNRLKSTCDGLLRENKELQGDMIRMSIESERCRLEEQAVIEELNQIKQSSQQMKQQISKEKEYQKNLSAMALEISLLKERNQMLLRERDEATNSREYMQRTNEDLQEKLVRIERALEELKDDYQDRAKENMQSDAFSTEEFSRMEHELTMLARTIDNEKAKCASLERVVVQKQTQIRELIAKLKHSREKEQLASKELSLSEQRCGRVQQELADAMEYIEQADINIRNLQEQLRSKTIDQKSEVQLLENNFEDRICELELALAMKQAQADQCMRKIEGLQAQKTELQEESLRPAAALYELEQALAEKSSANEAYCTEIKILTEERLLLQERIDQQASSIYSLEQSNQQLRQETGNLEFKMSQMCADLQAKEVGHRNMTHQLLELAKARSDLESKQQLQQSQLETANDRIQSLAGENKQLKRQLKESLQRIGEFKAVNEKLKASEEEKRQLVTKVADLSDKLNAQRKQCSNLMNRQCDLTQKLRELTESSARSNRQTTELERTTIQLQEALAAKESEQAQFERQLRSASSTISNSNAQLEHLRELLTEEKLARQMAESRAQIMSSQNQRILTESSTEKLSSHSQLMATITQLRSQNEKLHVQMCGMCKQETLDQLTSGYEAELQKERTRSKELSREVLSLRGSISELQEKLQLQRIESKRQTDEVRKTITLDRYKQAQRANEQWTKNELELNRMLEMKRQQLAEVRDKYRAEMERNRSLVESTGKELQELTERNLQLISKIEQLEKQLRAKEELTRRFISDKERLLANMTNEKQSHNPNHHPTLQDATLKLAIEKLKAQLVDHYLLQQQKSKAERRLTEEKKQLKEELFYLKRELENNKEDLLFQRKRNCHLEELYNKVPSGSMQYRSVRNVSSNAMLNLTKAMTPVQDKAASQGLDPPTQPFDGIIEQHHLSIQKLG